METDLKFFPSGDRGLLVKLGDSIDRKTNRRVHILSENVRRTNLDGVEDIVPGYCSLLILFDPLKKSYAALLQEIQSLNQNLVYGNPRQTRRLEIPVCYGGDYGPDLEDIATLHQLSEAEVIRQHSSSDYLVYFIGFCPGFPYMGEVPSSIATPRLARPRIRVPSGSVGIAGSQTGIYPIETPGGWRLIGQTPVKLFDPSSEPPNLLRAGDSVRFVPISPAEFDTISSEVERDSYPLKITAD